MAIRIDTASKFVDLHGAGKHGFGENPDIPIDTRLNAPWFNHTQEEICRALEDQGIAPAGGTTYNQLTTAINSWQFSGVAGIKSGADLRILSGGTLRAVAGAVFLVETTLEIDAAGNLACNGPAVFGGTVTLNQGATVAASQTLLGGAANTVIQGFGTIEGAVVQTTTGGRVQSRRIQVDSGAAPADTQITRDSDQRLHYGAGGLDLLIHASRAGLVYSKGQVDASGPLSAVTSTTDEQVAPLDTSGAEALLVEGKAMVFLNLAGTVTVFLQQGDGADPEVFADIGSGEIVAVSNAVNDFKAIYISRTVSSPGTTMRSYRLRIVGNGGTLVTGRSLTVEVKPGRAP